MTDDSLADLIVPHWAADSGPVPGLSMGGAGMHFGQGVVLEWNPDTGENVIDYQGEPLENLPIIGSTDILVTQPGDIVEIRSSSPAGGAGSYWIGGRIVVPGSEAAQRSIEFMRGVLAKEISAEIFAARIHYGSDIGRAKRSSTGYGDPDVEGDPGPSVPGVNIVSGLAIVMISAYVKTSTEDTTTNDVATSGVISFAVSGATDRDPESASSGIVHRAQKYSNAGPIDAAAGVVIQSTLTSIAVVSDLNPGPHTFTCKYASSGAPEPFECQLRNLVVIGL